MRVRRRGRERRRRPRSRRRGPRGVPVGRRECRGDGLGGGGGPSGGHEAQALVRLPPRGRRSPGDRLLRGAKSRAGRGRGGCRRDPFGESRARIGLHAFGQSAGSSASRRRWGGRVWSAESASRTRARRSAVPGRTRRSPRSASASSFTRGGSPGAARPSQPASMRLVPAREERRGGGVAIGGETLRVARAGSRGEKTRVLEDPSARGGRRDAEAELRFEPVEERVGPSFDAAPARLRGRRRPRVPEKSDGDLDRPLHASLPGARSLPPPSTAIIPPGSSRPARPSDRHGCGKISSEQFFRPLAAVSASTGRSAFVRPSSFRCAVSQVRKAAASSNFSPVMASTASRRSRIHHLSRVSGAEPSFGMAILAYLRIQFHRETAVDSPEGTFTVGPLRPRTTSPSPYSARESSQGRALTSFWSPKSG